MRPQAGKAEEVKIPVDPVTEQVVIAAACSNADARKLLFRRLVADHFAEPKHAAIWSVLGECDRRGLEFDLAVLRQLDPDVDVDYLGQLMEARPELPENLEHHVQVLLWDHAKVSLVRGPLSALIQAVRDPRSEPERVRSLAMQVGQALDGKSDRKYLRDPDQLIREQMAELQARSDGLACWSYGVDGLDYMDDAPAGKDPARRLVPGPAPGQITVVTGVPGVGKSTVTARLILGLARQHRRVTVGAWEQKGGMTLEILAILSAGLSRARAFVPAEKGGFTPEEMDLIRRRMLGISKWVTFMEIPFNRQRGEKSSNERNLDIVQGYIADSGCEVFVADLWKRCLRRTEPDEEELALIRQQAMAEEMKIHCILVQQQRLKDIEARADKKPTREGIKGSGAWTEVADTIIGVHRPALWKDIEDNVIELDILKQRYGKWPQAVEFDWAPDSGLLARGRTVPYDTGGNRSFGGEQRMDMFSAKPPRRKGAN